LFYIYICFISKHFVFAALLVRFLFCHFLSLFLFYLRLNWSQTVSGFAFNDKLWYII
jgi:hypothetical protein